MRSSFLFALLPLTWSLSFAQISVEKSVQLSAQYDSTTGFFQLSWPRVDQATKYDVAIFRNGIWSTLESLTSDTSYLYSGYTLHEKHELRVVKSGGRTGYGYIELGWEVPMEEIRGRCMVFIENSLVNSLSRDIDTLLQDLVGDGWIVDTAHISMNAPPVELRAQLQSWYTPSIPHALFLLGHIPVPYSGDLNPDGHPDHRGAWPSDAYYADIDGAWTDVLVNNSVANDPRNKNIPGDGKYDQSTLPSDVELMVGRVDFFDLPAFSKSYTQLTREYLKKSHAFKVKKFDVPRRALVENNFASFEEGFGQNGWKNFAPLFGHENIVRGDYEVDLANQSFLFAYACGPGSYTSMGGVGTTNSLYVEKELQCVFAMNFGSYFGDWDRTNNLLRAALGSGTLLANAWAGRPNWQFHTMALGDPIGLCAKNTQNNVGKYTTGYGAKGVHVALLGDPTLRLHPMSPPASVATTLDTNAVRISWEESPDAELGYILLRKTTSDPTFRLLTPQVLPSTTYWDTAVSDRTFYTYMVKAVRLEKSASGSYYNTSLGVTASIEISAGLPKTLVFVVDSTQCDDTEDGSITAIPDTFASSLTYLWDNMDTDSIAEGLGSGDYFLRVTSALGWHRDFGPITVFSPDKLTVQISTSPSSGTDGMAQALVSGGTPPYHLIWGDGTLDTTALPPGIYPLKITDAHGCMLTERFEVEMTTPTLGTTVTTMSVFPTLAHSELRVSCSDKLMLIQLQLTNIHGQSVISDVWSTSTDKVLDVSTLPRGVYYLTLEDGFYHQWQRTIVID